MHEVSAFYTDTLCTAFLLLNLERQLPYAAVCMYPLLQCVPEKGRPRKSRVALLCLLFRTAKQHVFSLSAMLPFMCISIIRSSTWDASHGPCHNFLICFDRSGRMPFNVNIFLRILCQFLHIYVAFYTWKLLNSTAVGPDFLSCKPSSVPLRYSCYNGKCVTRHKTDLSGRRKANARLHSNDRRKTEETACAVCRAVESESEGILGRVGVGKKCPDSDSNFSLKS
jgi:hypothetical protein